MNDHTSNKEPAPSLLTAFLAAVQFLLVSPAFIKRSFSAQELGRAVGLFPLVGLLLGGILVGLDYLSGLLLPDMVRSALLLAVWIALTGALHLDGFLDACDGLLGGSDPESRLRIMRDEHIGAYALAGGVMLLLLKFSALSTLEIRWPALLLAPVLGRWAIAAALVLIPYGRPLGLGREIKDHTGWYQAVQASTIAIVVVTCMVLWGRSLSSLVAVGAGLLATWFVVRFSLARLPGLTGDLYGAINEVVEVSVLVAMSAIS